MSCIWSIVSIFCDRFLVEFFSLFFNGFYKARDAIEKKTEKIETIWMEKKAHKRKQTASVFDEWKW